MKIQVAGLALALGVGGSVLAAPPTGAGIGCVQPFCYSAIAFSQSTGAVGLEAGDPTGVDADDGALAQCRSGGVKRSGSTPLDCHLVVEGDGTECIAIAANLVSSYLPVFAGKGDTLSDADSMALLGHAGYTVIDHQCMTPDVTVPIPIKR